MTRWAIAVGLVGVATTTRPTPVPAARPTQPLTLTVVVDGARSARGQLRFSLFAGPAGFPSDPTHAVRTVVIARQGERDSVQFSDLPAGRYAVAVHHDENDNGTLDTRFGFPREGWGATNNPRPRLRPPRFDEATVALTADRRVLITLTY